MNCPKCYRKTMAKVSSDKPNYICVNCGQKWKPAFFDYNAINRRLELSDKNQEAIVNDFFENRERELFLFKHGLDK